MTTRTITFDDEQWQVVPREPTDSMFAAADAENDRAFVDGRPHGAPFADMYYAALDAAPEPQVCFCDEKGIGDPAKSCGDCPRDYGMPTVRANPEPPAQQPTRDLLAEARDQVEALDRENHQMRRCVARLMARLTVWLDDDQFNEADGIVHPEFEPPAQQPTDEHTDMLRELLASYGNSGFSAERAALTAAIETLESQDTYAALLDCAEALQGLVAYARDSQGIAGYHMNGAILEWDDVEELHAGMNALARLNGDDHATSEPVGESNDG